MSKVVASIEDIRLGVRASQESRYDDAISSLSRVIKSGVQTDVVLYHFARSLFKVERYSESVGYWEDLLAHHSDTGSVDLKIKIRMNLAYARYMAARAETKQGQFRQAIEFLNKYLDNHPGDKKTQSIVPQLEELADDANMIRNHLQVAAAHIEAERWSEASDEFLALM